MRLWPAGTNVKYDANVNTIVNQLRRALGDSPDKPLYIETLPRNGYSWLVQPKVSDEAVTPLLVRIGAAQDSSEPTAQSGRRFQRSVWIIIGVIGLILAGMLLGAGITLCIKRVASYPLATGR